MLKNWDRTDLFRRYLNFIDAKKFEKKHNISLINDAIDEDNMFMCFLFIKLGCNPTKFRSIKHAINLNSVGYIKILLTSKLLIHEEYLWDLFIQSADKCKNSNIKRLLEINKKDHVK